MAIWISKLMNALCRPLVRRIGAELRPHHEREISALRRTLEPAILPLVLKNEIEHMQHLPIPFLDTQEDLVIVGFTSKELGDSRANLRCLEPPVADESSLCGANLLFLDEYHFIALIRQLPTLFAPVRKAILVPFLGSYLGEAELRQLLHRLGFIEIFLLEYDRLTGACSISGISHPAPITSLPLQVSPTAAPGTTTRWLVASRYPSQR